jgi:hypothetical protein
VAGKGGKRCRMGAGRNYWSYVDFGGTELLDLWKFAGDEIIGLMAIWAWRKMKTRGEK